MTAFCDATAPTGHACGYPPNACPIRTPIPAEVPDATPEELPPEKFDHDSLRPIAGSVIARLTSGALTPLAALRWLRVLHTYHQLPVPAMDDEETWKEVEFRGRIMHGMPPRDAEEWARAARLYDDEALEEFHRWEAELRGPAGPADSALTEDEGDDYAP